MPRQPTEAEKEGAREIIRAMEDATTNDLNVGVCVLTEFGLMHVPLHEAPEHIRKALGVTK